MYNYFAKLATPCFVVCYASVAPRPEAYTHTLDGLTVNLPPSTLEGRFAWLLAVGGMVAGLIGLGTFFKVGIEDFQTMTAVKWIFPLAILSARLTGSFFGVAIFLLFLQFLLYAAGLVVGSAFGRFRETLIGLLLCHIGAAVLCLMLT